MEHAGFRRQRWRNKTTFWWSNRNTGHQGLEIQRDWQGSITELTFSTVAQTAKVRYRIVFGKGASTARFYISPNIFVNDDECTQPSTEVEDFEPLTMDLIIAMMPAFMVQTHRQRSIGGCYAIY